MSAAPGQSRLLMSIAVMSAAFIQVLDTTIVNVALPHMAGELSATPDQISWVLTSYLVATGIFMPLSGYFTERWGQKKLLLVSVFGFVLVSGLCGVSTNLAEMVSFRILQGIFGAPILPLSQSVMVQAFSVEERGRAMAIWGMGVMLGPIFGPTVGGYLTDTLNWRWTFFINLPIGALSLLLAWRTVPDTPRQERTFDWTGLILLFFGIGGLQFIIDRGNQEDWFESTTIQIATLLSIVGMIGFIYHGLTHRGRALFDLRMFGDHNFAGACALVTMFSLGLFGAIVLTPIMLENLLGYPAALAGWLMAPRSIASMISMLLVGKLINRITPRMLVIIGIGLWMIGSFAMTQYSLNVSRWLLIWPVVMQGLALGPIFVPLATIAYATLPRSSLAEATGIYNLVRTLGSGIGISIVAAIMTHQTQVAWSELGSNIQPFNPALDSYLGQIGLDPNDSRTPSVLAYELSRQARMLGVLDAFAAIAWSFVLMVPLVFALQRGFPHRQEQRPPAASE